MSWLDELEARLEQQLAAFLAANPSQEALLGEQEARDRQAQMVGQRRQLQRQAEQERQALLHSMTAFSATLSPPDWTRKALGLSEQAVFRREASPFERGQLEVFLA
ncbi:MAG: hypothetical protein NWR94_07550, partial [Cyanobium sp. MAG_237]|nr:hypothetical protein [Cyanobium sp. MAG_237]